MFSPQPSLWDRARLDGVLKWLQRHRRWDEGRATMDDLGFIMSERVMQNAIDAINRYVLAVLRDHGAE